MRYTVATSARYKMARPGRPSKLTDQVREQINQYLTESIENNKVPTAARLAVNLGVSKSTLYKWAEDDIELSDTLKQLQSIQEATLIEGSLANKLNPTISKLMLANHGYHDKTDIDQNVKGDITWMNDVPRPGQGNEDQST